MTEIVLKVLTNQLLAVCVYWTVCFLPIVCHSEHNNHKFVIGQVYICTVQSDESSEYEVR